jgi:hypothetical protein
MTAPLLGKMLGFLHSAKNCMHTSMQGVNILLYNFFVVQDEAEGRRLVSEFWAYNAISPIFLINFVRKKIRFKF